MSTPKKHRAPARPPRRYRANAVVLKLHLPPLDTRGFGEPEEIVNGQPRWHYEMRVRQPNGRDRCKKILAEDLTAAEIVADRVAEEWSKGAIEVAEKAKRGWTVDDAFAHWQASLEETDGALTPGMMAVYRAEYLKEIAPVVGPLLIADVSDDHVRQFRKGLEFWTNQRGEKQLRMKRTVQRFLRRLRTILRFAREQGELKKIPGDAILKMKCRRVSDGGDMREHYPLSDDELAALLAEVRKSATPPVAMACQLVSIIGLREQEVTHLTTDCLFLDTEVPYIWIRSKSCSCALCLRRNEGVWKPKTRRERKIPLPPELVTEMRDYMAARGVHLVGRDSIYVFPMWERGKRYKAGSQTERSAFNDAVRRAVVALDFPVDKTRQLLTFHSLRSVAATNLDLRSHGNHTAVSIALGHALAGMSDRYNRLRDRLPELRDALYPDAAEGPKLVRPEVKQRTA
jgi:integrase